MKNFRSLLLLLTVAYCGCTQAPPPTMVEAPPAENLSADPVKIEAAQTEPAQTEPAKSRRFLFNYKFRVKDLQATGDAEQDLVRVWMPRPRASEYQTVEPRTVIAPAEITNGTEARYGNLYRYLQTPIPASGEFTMELPYQIERREVRIAAGSEVPVAMKETERGQFLGADKLVPTSGKSLELIKTVKLSAEPLALARQLYDAVDNHVVYKKEGTGWGRGDTNWVCESGYGNCTDFHSLFISLARSQGIPARFEIGFSIPTDKQEGPIVGYHCWAWFHVKDKGWLPVDISEADKHPELKEYYFGNLTADRVTFSVGRDLELSPSPANAPLNFFVYPHIEVGGKVLPKENVELQFSFEEK